MKIAIVTDKSRTMYLTGEEGYIEDEQKKETLQDLKKVLSKQFKCIEMTFDDNIISKLKKEKVDLVFNLCNGIKGDTKLAQFCAFMEFAGIPYTGPSILGHTLAYNKQCACKIFESSGIDTPDFITVFDVKELEDLEIKFPAIVKPCDEGSSRGIHQDSLVNNLDSLKRKVAEELSIYNPPIMVSEYIEGKEYSIGIVGNGEDIMVLPIVEVCLENLPSNMEKFYSFEVKAYYKNWAYYNCPAPLDEQLKLKIEDVAKRAYKALMLRDYARVDIRLRDNVAYVIEVNSLPGLKRDSSLIPRMAEACRLGYDGIVMKIVDSALKRYRMVDDLAV